MTRTNEFNQNLYYLGAICKHNHVFSNTSRSLRQKSNRTCVECQKNIKLKYVQSNMEICAGRMHNWRKRICAKEKISPLEKKCSVCDRQKTFADFYPEKYSLDGLRSHCKDCDKERQSNYRIKRRKPKVPKNPEIIKENKRKVKRRYKKSIKGKLANTIANHRRKAFRLMIESKNYTPTQLLSRFAEFNSKCVYCEAEEKISIDHFIPISKLGADSLKNIVPACIRCNSSKNNRNPESWFKSQSFFTLEKWQNIIERIQT